MSGASRKGAENSLFVALVTVGSYLSGLVGEVILRARVVALILLSGMVHTAFAHAAFAQAAPLDAKDPSITKNPAVDVRKTEPPHYPSSARTNGRQGEAKISLCIDVKGKVSSVELVESTGHADLDKATLEYAKKNLRMTPAEASGAPVAVCNYQFSWNWSLGRPRLAAPQ